MRKITTSVSIEKDIFDWMKDEIKKSRFASVSHACELALKRLRDSENPEIDVSGIELFGLIARPKYDKNLEADRINAEKALGKSLSELRKLGRENVEKTNFELEF